VALRQKQLREQHYAHINGIKIHNQWRKIMRLAKIEELRQQVEILSQAHEREVDRKDAQLQVRGSEQRLSHLSHTDWRSAAHTRMKQQDC